MIEQAAWRQLEAIHRLQLVVAVARHNRRLRRCLGRSQRDRERPLLGIGRVGRCPGHGLRHSLVARRAAIKAGDIAKIVVQRELRQPDLVDPQRSIERVEHRQLQQALADVGRFVGEGFFQERHPLPMVSQRLSHSIFFRRQRAKDRLQSLAVGIGCLHGEGRLRNFGPLRVGQRQQCSPSGLGGLVGNRQFIVGPRLVEPSLSELERPGEIVFAKLCSGGDVKAPLQQVAPQNKPFAGVRLRSQTIDIQLHEIGRLNISRHRPHLRHKRLHERSIKVGPPRCRQRFLEFASLFLILSRCLLVDPRGRRPGLEAAKFPLIFFPRSVVVGRQHHHGGHEQHHRRHRKHHMEQFEASPGLFCCRHGLNAKN